MNEFLLSTMAFLTFALPAGSTPNIDPSPGLDATIESFKGSGFDTGEFSFSFTEGSEAIELFLINNKTKKMLSGRGVGPSQEEVMKSLRDSMQLIDIHE